MSGTSSPATAKFGTQTDGTRSPLLLDPQFTKAYFSADPLTSAGKRSSVQRANSPSNNVGNSGSVNASSCSNSGSSGQQQVPSSPLSNASSTFSSKTGTTAQATATADTSAMSTDDLDRYLTDIMKSMDSVVLQAAQQQSKGEEAERSAVSSEPPQPVQLSHMVAQTSSNEANGSPSVQKADVNKLLSQLNSYTNAFANGSSETSTPSIEICQVCFQNVPPFELVTISNKIFHSQCLRCNRCKQIITDADNVNFFGDKIICKDGCKETRCASCLGDISGKDDRVAYKDSLYHRSCFYCAMCMSRLDDVGLMNVYEDSKGQLLCRTDYERICPKCPACSVPIVDASGVSVGNFKFHEKCLSCQDCSKQLSANTAFVLQPSEAEETSSKHPHPLKEGRPLCEFDYYNRRNLLCSNIRCRKPIRDRFLRVAEKKFHMQCFACTHCNVSLEQKPSKIHSDRVYCLTCYGIVR